MDALFLVSGRIAHALAVLTRLLLAGVVMLVCADVAARNLGRPLAWGVSLTEYGLIYIAFLPMPLLVRDKGHVCADFIRTALPAPLRAAIERGVYLLCLALCLALGGVAFDSAVKAWSSGAYDVRTFDMPRALIFAPMVLGLWLSAIEFLRYLLGRDSIYAIAARDMEGF
jgi:TRAP-type C4-dicarboxylate transport system permease small subunit